MKFLFTLVLGMVTFSSFSQLGYSVYDITFEDSFNNSRINIDTVSNPDNIWQIGAPNKTVFDSAFSVPNVMVTDTQNSYPPNDTSIFILTHIAQDGYFYEQRGILEGYYQVNSDSLTDYGTIEFSPDNGITWIDLLTDTLYYNQGAYYWSERPTLTGNSEGWKPFYVNTADFTPLFDIQEGDTVLFRFTFISDSIETNKDGLMFDNFQFDDWSESIYQIQNQFESNVYPNPALTTIKIEFERKENAIYSISIFNNDGKLIYQKQEPYNNSFTVDLEKFMPGNYYYKITNHKNNQAAFGRFIKM